MNVKIFQISMLIIVTTLVIAGGVFIIAWRMVLSSDLPSFWNRMLMGIVMAPLFFPLILFSLKYFHMEVWFDRLLVLSFLVAGFFSFLLVFSVFRDAMHIGFLLLKKICPGPALHAGTFLKQGGLLLGNAYFPFTNMVILILSALLFGIGLFQAFSLPSITCVAIPLDELPASLNGFKIVQLSDIHLDVMTGGSMLERIVEKVNEIGPDITVITGDLVDGSVGKRGDDAKTLRKIASPVYFVNGNHEYYFNHVRWNRFLDSIGIVVLNNEKRIIRKGDASLMIAGIPDFFMSARFDGRMTIPKPEGADCYLLLSHRPGAAYEAARLGYSLQLSGHTHGGQYFPWNFLIRFVEPFSQGLYRLEQMWIYTSRGTGFWGPPVRLFAPQEITVLTLCSS